MIDRLRLLISSELITPSFCNFNFQLAHLVPQFLVIKVPRNLSQFYKHLVKYYNSPKNEFFTKKSWHIITYYDSPGMNPHSLYFIQCPKYEPFSCYFELKILMLCIYVMYELAQLKNFIEQSEFEMAGYL